MTKMIPPIPTSAVMMPTPKQKIGFSIESIVGNDAQQQRDEQTQQHHHHHHHHQTTRLTAAELKSHSPPKLSEQSKDIQDIINRLHNTANNLVNINNSQLNSYSPATQRLSSPDVPHNNNILKRERSITPPSSSSQQQLSNSNHQLHHSPSASPPSHQPSSPPLHSPFNNLNKGPIHVPGLPPTTGLVRPFPVNAPQHPDIKALPPYINSPDMVPAPPQHPGLLAAAQFQMAAALQAGHVLGPAAAAVAAGLPPHSPFLQQHPAAMARDSYPLYPWLLSRHGRIFPHRFPGHFLLQPFRKPKRIRTAFSPSQLLKLEHAFESNQYVVGAERKQLAQSLNLSETQVKVWFQNRRTKHKRMQQEDEKGGCSSNGDMSGKLNSCDEDEDELIDMEMDEYPSDDELDASH